MLGKDIHEIVRGNNIKNNVENLIFFKPIISFSSPGKQLAYLLKYHHWLCLDGTLWGDFYCLDTFSQCFSSEQVGVPSTTKRTKLGSPIKCKVPSYPFIWQTPKVTDCVAGKAVRAEHRVTDNPPFVVLRFLREGIKQSDRMVSLGHLLSRSKDSFIQPISELLLRAGQCPPWEQHITKENKNPCLWGACYTEDKSNEKFELHWGAKHATVAWVMTVKLCE